MRGHVALVKANESDIADRRVVWLWGYPFRVEVSFYDTSKQTIKGENE